MSERAIPETITCSEQIFSVSFHPQRPLLAAGLIDGTVELWEHEHEDFAANRFLQSLEHHKASCRALAFHPNGQHLYTTSSDKSWHIVATEDGQSVRRVPNAHNHSINRLKILNDYLFTTGDDGGVVKLWDNRIGNATAAVLSWDAHTDFVTDFAFVEENHQLFSTSGDATLCVYDIRNEKHFYKSDDQESELHCVQVMKGGRKVVCGCQDGVMLLFNEGQWGDCSDRIPGHPETVDCMWKIDESTVLTGSSDGMIRAISVLPNKVLGVLGDHEDASVEDIIANRDQTILASIANDEQIRFWDISVLIDEDGGDEEEGAEDSSDEDSGSEQAAAAGVEGVDKKGKKKALKSIVGEGMDSEDDMSEDDDEEEEEEGDGDSDDEEEDSEEDEEDSEASSEDEEDEDEGESVADKNKRKKAESTKKAPTKKEESDSDDSDDDSDNQQNKRKRLPTAAEKFYADM